MSDTNRQDGTHVGSDTETIFVAAAAVVLLAIGALESTIVDNLQAGTVGSAVDSDSTDAVIEPDTFATVATTPLEVAP